MKRFLVTAVSVLCLVLAVGAYFASQYILASRVVEPVVENKITTLDAEEDFSSYAEPVADENGVLFIPDNTAVSNFTATTIRTRHFSFSIPERWVNNVVIKVMTINNEEGLTENPLHDAFVVQFFEKSTYAKYRTQEFVHTKNSSVKGKLTEIMYLPMTNNTKELDNNARQMKFAYVPTGDTTYEAYILQIGQDTGTSDDEYADIFSYLVDANYADCIIKSFEPAKGTKLFTDGYVEYLADVYLADTGGPDMPEDYIPLHGSAVQPYNPSYEQPKYEQLDQNATPVFKWERFSLPWAYVDGGNMYQFSAQESGGAVPSNLIPGTVS